MDMNVPRKRKRAAIDDHDELSFFTVIVSPATQLHKLELPKQFVNDHGKLLPDCALLHVPDGENYPVELLKHKSDVFIHKGWNQFATNYSIQAGTFLLFTFHGRSKFLVLIFDARTALEIDYPIPKRNGEFEPPKVDTTPLERAKAFQSSNPYFIIKIHKRNLHFNSGPWLPTDHCRTHFKQEDGNGNMILIVDNKPWTVKYRLEKVRKCAISMATGWREFALENTLQEGDVCVFEMIKSSPKTYHVHLFRVSGDDINTGRRGRGRKKRCSPLMEKAEAFVRNSPGFAIAMRKTYVSGLHPVYIPSSHSKQYFKDEGADLNVIAINGEGEKAWRVKYHFKESYPRLGSGWGRFRSDNDLQIGDVCGFKLINKARKIYKLAIFRGNAE